MISEYRSRGMNISRILALLKIPRSTHYYSPPSLQIRRGRKSSLITERITDSGIIAITDGQILLDITDLLSKEFVCYGYKKVRKYLRRSGYIINRKKVFRILKENNLLNYTYNYRSPARRVDESIVSILKGMRSGRWISSMYTYMDRAERHTCLPSSTVTPGRLWESIWDITALPRM